jgi:hypothetical protein
VTRTVPAQDTPTVHILKTGLPLCGFSKLVPREWPTGHYWVSIQDPARFRRVNCTGCQEAIKKEKPRA